MRKYSVTYTFEVVDSSDCSSDASRSEETVPNLGLNVALQIIPLAQRVTEETFKTDAVMVRDFSVCLSQEEDE